MSRGRFALLAAFIVILTTVMMAPFAWMVSTSFKPLDEVFQWPPRWIPENPTLSNYPKVLREVSFDRFFLNSIFVASITVIGVLLTSSLAGYAFAKFEFAGKNVLFLIILGTMMVPYPVLVIPMYMLMDRIGWVDTYWALIVPGLTSAFGIFMMRQFIQTIPSDLMDAARIDGCGELRVYSQIVLPAAKPALSTLAVLTFMWNWDSFLWPVIIINRTSMRTVPLGLAMFMWEYGGPRWNLIMAGTVISTIPVLVVFLLGQKQIVSGMVLSGMKG